MKKLWSISTSAALVSGGVFAMAPTATSAEPGYPGSVDTTCHANALNSPRHGNDAKVEFKVTTGGNGGANGAVTFTYVLHRDDTAHDEFSRQYTGPGWNKYAFPTGQLPRGTYTVKVVFNSKPAGSVYKNCRTKFTQEIRKQNKG